MLFAASALAASVCLGSKSVPKLPRAVDLTIATRAADVLNVEWSLKGESGPGELAAVVTVHFADGHTLVSRATTGAQVSSSPNTRRDVEVIPLPDGGWGTRQTIVLGSASPVDSVNVSARISIGELCVVAYALATDPTGVAVGTDTSGWYRFSVADRVGVLPAALAVEGPAGARGFVSQDPEGRLRYPDGSRARFWGTNLMVDTAFPEKSDADARAETLARMGFNLVRLHHVDKTGRGVVDADRGKPGHDDVFDDVKLDRFDWFVSRLEAHGVHIWAEVATSREFSAADGVKNPEAAPSGHKLYPMWEPDWEAAYMEWFSAFWGRKNPYTKRAYADDPAVVVLELANEHSLVIQWGFGLEALAPSHLSSLQSRWNAWLATRYPNDAAIVAAWGGSVHPGLQTGESLASASIAREPMYPALADRWPAARQRDLLAFYAYLEEGFYARLAEKARSLRFRVPMVPTILYNRPLLQVLHRDTAISDLHIAYDKGGDGVIDGTSLLQKPAFAIGMLPAAVAGTAVTASELTHAWPSPWRAEGPWLWTALASVQDWDVLIWSFWDAMRADPVVVTQLPAASAAFRGEWIPAASGLYPMNLSSVSVLAAGGQFDRPIPLDLLHLPTVLTQRVRTFIDRPMQPAAGDRGASVGWWSTPGFLVIDTPNVQSRVGFPGEPTSGAGPAEPSRLRVQTPLFAAVSLASADGRPLTTSRAAWLNVAGVAQPTGATFANFGTTVRNPGETPVIHQPFTGSIAIRWNGKPRVEALDGSGAVMAAIPVSAEGEWWVLDVSAIRSPWLKVSSP